jgi:phosphoserine phosphatase RsbU/P
MTVSRMQCMQVWGGSGVADTSVSTTGLDVSLYCKPFQNDDEGGDVYFLSSCSSGRITRIILADVRGHGYRVVALAKSLRGLMQRHIDHVNQKTLVQAINREFSSVGDASTFATGLIVTFFVPNRTLTLTNAGHPAPLLFSAERHEWRPLEYVSSSTEPSDVPLGILESANYSHTKVKMTTGDLLLCFTDGLEDCVDEQGEMLGKEGVLKLVAGTNGLPPAEIIPEILRRVSLLSKKTSSEDDVTIMLVRPNGESVSLQNNLLAPFRYVSNLLGLRR